MPVLGWLATYREVILLASMHNATYPYYAYY
jgi:hypothetical protein